MLRALAQAGGGTYEFFDTKMKHTWAEKVIYAVVFVNIISSLFLRLELNRFAGGFRCTLRFSVWSLKGADQWQ